MAARSPYDYAIVRVVPRVEREEFVNVGAIVFARTRDFLACAIELDAAVVRALAPAADLDAIAGHLDAFAAVCAGAPDAGPVAALPAPDRFHWLTAPRSTVIQTGPIHVGVTDDPAAALRELIARRVRRS